MIARVIEDFIEFYYAAFKHDLSFNLRVGENVRAQLPEADAPTLTALKHINTGDCFAAAAAIGMVLEYYRLPVDYVSNSHHGFIEVQGRYYDTLRPNGFESVKDALGYISSMSINRYGRDTFISQYVSHDRRAHSIVTRFHYLQTGVAANVYLQDKHHTDYIPLNRVIHLKR